MSISTTEFLARIKRGVSIPAIQYRFTDTDLLLLGDEEMESRLLPEIMSIRQAYYVKFADQLIVTAKSNYKIPYRAVGRTIVDLEIVDSTGTYVRKIPQISISDKRAFVPLAGGDPRAFTIEGDNIVLLPTPTASTTVFYLRIYYALKPSKLVPTTDCATITAINTTTGDLTISAANSTFATADVMDLIDGKTSNMNKAEDITNTNYIATTVTFAAADLPDDLAVGDIITQSDESCYVQAPQEFIQSLVQAVICRTLEAQGDFEGLQAAQAELERRLMAGKSLMANRVEQETPVVINRRGLLTQRPYYVRTRIT